MATTGKRRTAKKTAGAAAAATRVFDARPDTLDFRDLMYVPTLVEVPTHVPVDDCLKIGVPVLEASGSRTPGARGYRGLCHVSYDDWLDNGTDAWVARLGAPVTLRSAGGTAQTHATAAGQSVAYSYADLRPHVVSVGNDGRLRAGGEYGTKRRELAQIFSDDMPRVMRDWPVKRVLLYAHGGLVGEQAAAQRLAEYRPPLLAAGVYPLAFIWRTDYWTTLTNILQDAVRRRRPEGVLDAAKDFMLNRLDDALEPLARLLTGKLQWDEMKENALAASKADGAARLVAEGLAKLAAADKTLEIHVVAHSAGAILQAPLLRLLTSMGLKVRTCALWAPACTVDLFKDSYLPAIESGDIGRFTMFALNDQAEQDDNCARIYNKSLLYLVSNAFEAKARIPLARDGVPLLGMQKFVARDAALTKLFGAGGRAELVLAPNNAPAGSLGASSARHHGDFDDDPSTVQATFARILQAAAAKATAAAARAQATAKRAAEAAPADAQSAFSFQRSASSLRDRRSAIDAQTRLRG